MKTGDPKKATILGVVAIVVLGVAVMQIVPKGESAPARKPAATADPVADGDLGALVVSARERLRQDPFTHPKLQKGDGPETPTQAGSQPPSNPPPTLVPGGEVLPGAWGQAPVQPPNPAGNDGGDQQSDGVELEDARVEVMIEGIVSAVQSKAFVKVGANPAVGLAVGDKIPGLGRIEKIDETAVTIRTASGTHVLRVGEVKKL